MGRSTEQVDQAMDRITVEGERMRSLVEELLLLARLDQGVPFDRTAVIEVSDEGPGMTAEESAHAFDRFYRAEPSRSRPGGSGLGLAIVQAIVDAHHGTVELDTAPGEGATFTATLPTGLGRPEPR